jgi:hypothetical protein
VAHKAEKESYEHQLAELRAEYAKTKEERLQNFSVEMCRMITGTLGAKNFFFYSVTVLTPEPDFYFFKRLRSPSIDSKERFRKPMRPGGPVRPIGLSTCRTGPPGWESIPGLLKRGLQIRALVSFRIQPQHKFSHWSV